VFAIKRREFITLLGGAAAAWSFTAHAQQPTIPVIGFLSSLSAPVTTKRISSFGEGLSELGYNCRPRRDGRGAHGRRSI
jgi:putative tryptophan/tyrosine transport system substrate-binding protein